MSSNLVAEVIDAHGGIGAWRAHAALDVTFSARGLAFASKGHPHTLRGVHVRIATEGQHVEFDLAAWPGWCAHLDGGGIHVRNPAGVSHTRARPRAWALRWDRCDLAWFCAQAIWTYVSLPFVLADPSVAVAREMPGRRLEVSFAPEIHTHCRTQVLHIDHRLRIVRHDYTADAFGRWARAAQCVNGHRYFDGLLVGTERFVHPRRRDGRPRRHPLLVSIAIEGVTAGQPAPNLTGRMRMP